MDILYGPSKQSLNEDLQDLQKSEVHAFFNDHMDDLIDRIFLVDAHTPQASLLKSHIYEIGKLSELYKNEFSQTFTREANLSINPKFNAIIAIMLTGGDLTEVREEIEGMIDVEIDRLADTINPFTALTARDIVEENVNIHGRIFENISEAPETERFYELFTVEYINLLGATTSSIDGELQVDREGLLNVMGRVKERLSESYRAKLSAGFTFTTLSGDEEVGFDDIFIRQESYTIKELQRYIGAGINLTEFIGHLSYDYIVKFYREGIISKELIFNFLLESRTDLSRTEIIQLYNEGILLNEEAWKILEGEDGFQKDKNEGFSLSDALTTFGLSDGLIRDTSIIFERQFTDQEKIHLTKMIQYFLYIESSTGYNVANYKGKSTAKGYFQYLTGDGGHLRSVMDTSINKPRWSVTGRWRSGHSVVNTGRHRVRREWGNNSYETGLGRIPEEILINRPVLNAELKKRGNPAEQDPRILSAEEQIILFISDLKERVNAEQYIEQMLQGDIAAVESLYRAHHTNTDDETEVKMLLAKREVYGIPIEVYQRDANSVTGLILPRVNITSFFMRLIKEFNPGTGLSSTNVMNSLDSLGNFSFPAGKKIKISGSSDEGYAYNLELNGSPYMRINNDGEFSLR